ncbi:MAG: DUF4258 domain-containing protein [Acetobacterium sp.]|nr:DUF4258 domain-containing protein [Acetobacterium sp.]
MNVTDLKDCVLKRKIKWTAHVAQRIQERDISKHDITHRIVTGEIIEQYPEDYPNPSCLIFGSTINESVIHVVVGFDFDFIFIITAYYPNTNKFEADMKTRKES